MNYVLGIDGGGSKTLCILMDDKYQVLGRGAAGASNYQSIGVEAARQSIYSAIQTAANEALKFTNTIEISAFCLGLAGVGRSRDIEVVRSMVQELQNSQFLPITWDLQPANIIICHDALIALVGGIGHDVGIVVAAGTGSIIFGRNQQGDTKRVGGWGYILGDEGSAYKIAVAGMQAALKSYDGWEISTSLISDFQQHLGLQNIAELIEVIYQRGWGVKEIASLAQIVDLAAASGDTLANNIIDDVVQELVKATSTVINAIFSPNSVCEIVTTGSVWRGESKIHKRFTKAIVNQFPRVKVSFPCDEPAYGAGLLALQSLSTTGLRF
ncbi:N-acetylglucosamine kinase [Nostoc sp. PCC 7107]|uniref:N-acetylglucosamine kinase n=1 Tax=Nostoc sp. PCC 7107 TaxID=317936 RepID=UPI00029F3E76|nr:N-acetylglucosamine kinase [Nostoc sp. PCC 7107]AFY43623.1 ATPase BadF/BadG/BcrA/BcrD type [Nostoc sp. PCC 7107]